MTGVPALTKTSKRACLSLGALAKTLHETNISESDRVVKRLETWLEPYNHSKILLCLQKQIFFNSMLD